MASRQVKITNALGLHARAAAKFVEIASRFQSRIQIVRNGDVVDGKSILGILTLAAGRGSELELVAEGSDEEQALDALEQLVNEGFGENV